MKDILEAFFTRVKSPVFGYSVFAWFTINWKVFTLLIFSNDELLDRIEMFQDSTNIYCLLIYPFALGSLLTVISPWLNYPFLILAKKPTELKNNIQLETEHKRLLHKTVLEKELITKKREVDTELSKIEDEGVRARANEDLNNLNNNIGSNNKLKADTKISLYQKATSLIQKMRQHANKVMIHETLMDEIFAEVPMFLIELNSYDFINNNYSSEIMKIQEEYNNLCQILDDAKASDSQKYELSYVPLIESLENLQKGLLS